MAYRTILYGDRAVSVKCRIPHIQCIAVHITPKLKSLLLEVIHVYYLEMDMTTAAALMNKSWEDIKCAIHPKEDGFHLDAAVMAWIICDADSGLRPLEDSICDNIVQLIVTFLDGKSCENDIVRIPCNVNEVQCLKDFVLGDAVKFLLYDDVPKSAGECSCINETQCKLYIGQHLRIHLQGQWILK